MQPLSLRALGLILLTLYALSGLTSLSYEVLWARALALHFGVSIFGVVVSVAAFMAGLGLGSIMGAHYSHRTVAPLRWFALLEGGVALYALLSPWLLQGVDALLGMASPHLGLWAWYTLQGVATLLALLLPALAMGAAFAFMLKALAPTRIGLGVLYGLNACGGAVGALLPLWLLPAFGWTRAIQGVAAVGVLVSVAALLWARAATAAPHAAIKGDEDGRVRPSRSTLWAYAAIGAAALMLEVGWTRLFGMILLRTEYVLAVILAVFVAGIGVGSLLARLALRGRRAELWFSLLPWLAGVFALLSLWWLPVISAWAEQAQFGSLSSAIAWQAAVLAAVTLPVTLTLGAWLPLLCARIGATAPTGARLYGVNSVGAALGTMAGLLLLPWLGTVGVIVAAALLVFIAGHALIAFTQGGARPTAFRRGSVFIAGLAALLLLAWPVRSLPPVQQLLPQAQAGSRDLYRHEDALTITHVVERIDGQRVLLTDLQRMDAATDQAAVAVQENQARLPLLLHPAPRSVLFLGLGTGISAAGSLPFPTLARTGVELSQGAIQAARTWFTPLNEDVFRHMRVARDDARRFLRADTNHYDVIIGDVFHPDLAGHGALLSVQQFARARARLAEHGLFVQWLALNQFDLESLRTVLRSFQTVFPDAAVFMDGFRLALVGPKDELQGAPALLANLERLARADQQAASGGEGAWTWLGRYWGTIAPSLGPLQDEALPHVEYLLPRARYRGDFDLTLLVNTLLNGRPRLEQAAAALNVRAADLPEFERAYSATELALRGWLMALQGREDGVRLIRLAQQANPNDRWISFSLADSMLATLPQALARGLDERAALLKILAIRPDHAEVLRALWRVEREAGNLAQAETYRARLRAASPLDKELRTQQ